MLVESFTAGQNPLSPNIITLTDTSTGSDSDVTVRRVYFINAAGEYVVESGTTTDYEVWPYADASISLDLLTEATALSIRVDWLDISGTVLYTVSETYCFAEYLKQFAYYLAQLIAMTPPIVGATNYETNLGKLWTSIWGAINAIEVQNDIACSQNNLDRGTYLKLHQNLFY